MTSSIFLILSSSSSCNPFRRLSSSTRSFSLFTTHWILSSIDLKLSSTSFLISASRYQRVAVLYFVPPPSSRCAIKVLLSTNDGLLDRHFYFLLQQLIRTAVVGQQDDDEEKQSLRPCSSISTVSLYLDLCDYCRLHNDPTTVTVTMNK